MKRQPHPRLTAPALACAVLALSGCSTVENFFGGEKADYRSSTSAPKPLEVPPDLSQLARDSRYQVQGGAISASAVSQAGGAAAGATAGAVAAKPTPGGPAIAPLSRDAGNGRCARPPETPASQAIIWRAG